MHKNPHKKKSVQHVYVGNNFSDSNRKTVKRQYRNLFKKQNRKQLSKFMCEIEGRKIMMLDKRKTNIFFHILFHIVKSNNISSIIKQFGIRNISCLQIVCHLVHISLQFSLQKYEYIVNIYKFHK